MAHQMQEIACKDEHHHANEQERQSTERCSWQAWKEDAKQPADDPCKVCQRQHPYQLSGKGLDACIQWQHPRGHGQGHRNQKTEQTQGDIRLVSHGWNQAIAGKRCHTIEEIEDAS